MTRLIKYVLKNEWMNHFYSFTMNLPPSSDPRVLSRCPAPPLHNTPFFHLYSASFRELDNHRRQMLKAKITSRVLCVLVCGLVFKFNIDFVSRYGDYIRHLSMKITLRGATYVGNVVSACIIFGVVTQKIE